MLSSASQGPAYSPLKKSIKPLSIVWILALYHFKFFYTVKIYNQHQYAQTQWRQSLMPHFPDIQWPSISPWKLIKNQKASLQTALGQMPLYTMHREITLNKSTHRTVLLQMAEPMSCMYLGVHVPTTVIKINPKIQNCHLNEWPFQSLILSWREIKCFVW